MAISAHKGYTMAQNLGLRNRKITSDAIFHVVNTLGVYVASVDETG